MTQEEFASRVYTLTKQDVTVSDADWKIIDFVYTNHPAISDDSGKAKEQIAWIWSNLGMQVLRDMYGTAETAATLRKRIQSNRLQIAADTDDLRRLRYGLKE